MRAEHEEALRLCWNARYIFNDGDQNLLIEVRAALSVGCLPTAAQLDRIKEMAEWINMKGSV